MSISLLTYSQLRARAEQLVTSFASWSTGAGADLDPAATSHVRLRGYSQNVQAFVTEGATITGADGYSSLDSDLKTDVETIAAAATSAASTISSLLDPDTLFGTLDSARRTAIATDFGLGTDEDITTVDDAWATVPPDLKADVLQHDLIGSDTVTAILAALAIT